MRREPRETHLPRILPYGFLAYAALLVLSYLLNDGLTAYHAGRMFTPVLFATALVWLAARGSDNAWRWWVYPSATLGTSLLLGAALSLPDVGDAFRDEQLEAASPDVTAPEVPSSAGAVSVDLSAPSTRGGWRELRTAAALREVERVVEASKAELGTQAVVGGYYVHAKDPTNPMLFWGINEQLGADIDAGLRELLAGAAVPGPQTFDVGTAGGALMCGDGQHSRREWTACAWSTGGTTAILRWELPVDLERAAELSRDFLRLAGA